MMSIVFIVFLIAVLLAWQGRRRAALITFAMSLLLGVIVFIHHITDQLNLNL